MRQATTGQALLLGGTLLFALVVVGVVTGRLSENSTVVLAVLALLFVGIGASASRQQRPQMGRLP